MHRLRALLSIGLLRALLTATAMVLVAREDSICSNPRHVKLVGGRSNFYAVTRADLAINDRNTGFLGKGRYQIQNVESGYFLALRADRQRLQQWSSSGALDQQWDVEDAGSGYFYLRSVQTGKVLAAMNTRDGRLGKGCKREPPAGKVLAAMNTRDGADVLAKEERINGRDQQKWRIVDLGNGQALMVTRAGKAGHC